MSKGNLFLGQARGKVGDVVFYVANGEQIARARNRSPKNPKSARQCVARSIMNTVSDAYSLFQPLTDHSFENRAVGTPNQSRFTQLNVDMLRTRVLEGVDLSNPEAIAASELYNFAGKPYTLPVLNTYFVSEGMLPALDARMEDSGPYIEVPAAMPSSPTYAQVCSYLGLMQGDQLTFLWVYGTDSDDSMIGLMTSIEYSRVILEPSNGDMTRPFLDTEGKPSLPNERNTGRIIFDMGETGKWEVMPAPGTIGGTGDTKVCIGFAAIVSRRQGSAWRRSTARIQPRTGGISSPWVHFLGDAALSYTNVATGSSLYLNQATGF